jgi:hypothetical protein
MTTPDDPLQEAIDRLLAHGFTQAAQDFQMHVAKLASTSIDERLAAAEAIEQRSNPRWLGDLYLEGMTLLDWWGLLEKAAKVAKRKASKRGPLP